jgi:hypothetical protein
VAREVGGGRPKKFGEEESPAPSRLEVEPATVAGVVLRAVSRRSAMHWRSATARTDAMLGTGEEALYAVGWTLSGLATLGTIVAVWMFGM